MNITQFITNFREAFGEKTPLPILFWYSDEPYTEPRRINGCFFKGFHEVREGAPLTLSFDTVTCPGGKFYTGFIEMPERIPGFVSLNERYKQTPEFMLEFLEQFEVTRAPKPYLNFVRIDRMESFAPAEGVLFFASPDVLAGLTTWAWFDNNADDTVSTLFGSGCSILVTSTIKENRSGGRRTFLAGFDPSVRPHLGVDELIYTIPMSRFAEMYRTMRQSCLFDTHAWRKLRERFPND